jgi:hypothetical protein
MQALIEELRKLEYASLSDEAAADAINAKAVLVRQLVPTANVVAHASQNSYRHKLTQAANNLNHPCNGLAIDILAYIDSVKIQNVDMDLPETQEMLAAMVQCGFATEQQVASLDGLADQTVRWVDHEGIGTLGRGAVYNARLEISRWDQ